MDIETLTTRAKDGVGTVSKIIYIYFHLDERSFVTGFPTGKESTLPVPFLVRSR